MSHSKIYCGIVFCFLAASVSAFDENGLRSGMTFDEVRKKIAPHVLANSELPNEDMYFIAQKGGPAVGSVAFCKGKLISYLRYLNFDSQYGSTLRDTLNRFGNPSDVRVVKTLKMDLVELIWNKEADSIFVGFTVRESIAKRYAAIEFSTKSECDTERSTALMPFTYLNRPLRRDHVAIA